MSLPSVDQCQTQDGAKPVVSPPTSRDNKHKWLSLASSALLLSGVSLTLVGCQSAPMAKKATPASGALIDFNTVDATQRAAQSQAFIKRMQADGGQYAQIFDQDGHPSAEQQAKNQLLTAIRQHLATEHLAVSKASYHVKPYTDASSIDTGASGLLRTAIETYLYQQSQIDDGSADYDLDGYDLDSDEDASEYDLSEEQRRAVAEMVKQSSTELIDNMEADEDLAFGEDGFNGYGYDKDGYHRDDYNHDDDDNYDDEDNDYDNNYNSDNESANDSRFSFLSKVQPKELLSSYEAMQVAKAAGEYTSSLSGDNTGIIGMLLGGIHKTPEQTEALNAYQYQYLTINSVSHYQPTQKQLQSVYSYDYIAPTIQASVQIPLGLDFKNSRLTIDPSAFMPLMALADPEDTALPDTMATHTVDFGLPESVTSQISSAVLYDAFMAALQDSISELAPDYFSSVTIADDSFAQQVGADKAIKVYFGSQQSGEMVGKMIKYMSQSLQRHVDSNPDQYPDGAALKLAIDKIQQYNKGYQSADVGALLQLVEAVSPFSFHYTNYYYLDRSNQLLAKQQRVNLGSDLLGSTTSVVNQTRYDAASVQQSRLTPLLQQTFASDAPPAIDGNERIMQMRQKKAQLDEARYARYGYEDTSRTDTDEYSSDDYDNDSYDNEAYEMDDSTGMTP